MYHILHEFRIYLVFRKQFKKMYWDSWKNQKKIEESVHGNAAIGKFVVESLGDILWSGFLGFESVQIGWYFTQS